jgi:hypothetical protein
VDGLLLEDREQRCSSGEDPVCAGCVVRYAGSGGVKYELDAAQQGDCGRNAPPDKLPGHVALLFCSVRLRGEAQASQEGRGQRPGTPRGAVPAPCNSVSLVPPLCCLHAAFTDTNATRDVKMPSGASRYLRACSAAAGNQLAAGTHSIPLARSVPCSSGTCSRPALPAPGPRQLVYICAFSQQARRFNL